MNDRMRKLQSLLEADPHDAFCLYGLAMEYAREGDVTKAISLFDRAIASDPDACYAYYHKGRCLIDQGNEPAAAQTLAAGLERARATSDAHAAGEIQALLDEIQ